jgi:hypothetical protein
MSPGHRRLCRPAAKRIGCQPKDLIVDLFVTKKILQTGVGRHCLLRPAQPMAAIPWPPEHMVTRVHS